MARRLPSILRVGSCPSCPSRSMSLPLRHFATSRTIASEASPQAAAIPPESPRHTPVPQSLQATHTSLPRVRGVMPTPRNILSRKKDGVNQFSDENVWTYLKKTAPKPRKPMATQSPNDPEAERNQYKARASFQRRQNLLQGIQELKLRKTKDRYHLSVKTNRSKDAKAALKVERDARRDEELTNPSVPEAMRRQPKGKIPDPNREERIVEMKARAEAKEAARVSDRRDALHTLYMHAREFITTEEQLDAAIEQTFGSLAVPRTFGPNYGISAWDVAPPESIENMLARANGTRNTVADNNDGAAVLSKERLKRIAEEFTGGKL